MGIWWLSGLLLLAAVGCSSGVGVASEDEAARGGGAAASPSEYPWLQVMEGGILRVPASNGTTVSVVDDIAAEIFVSPYPPGLRTDLDLYLLQGIDGTPVTDATVELVSDMVFMDHGSFALPGKSIGEGHYVLPLNFLMYGEWHVEFNIVTADGREGSIWMVWGVFPH